MLLQALSLLFLFPGLDVVEATEDGRGVETTTLPASETKSSSTARLISSFKSNYVQRIYIYMLAYMVIHILQCEGEKAKNLS